MIQAQICGEVAWPRRSAFSSSVAGAAAGTAGFVCAPNTAAAVTTCDPLHPVLALAAHRPLCHPSGRNRRGGGLSPSRLVLTVSAMIPRAGATTDRSCGAGWPSDRWTSAERMTPLQPLQAIDVPASLFRRSHHCGRFLMRSLRPPSIQHLPCPEKSGQGLPLPPSSSPEKYPGT